MKKSTKALLFLAPLTSVIVYLAYSAGCGFCGSALVNPILAISLIGLMICVPAPRLPLTLGQILFVSLVPLTLLGWAIYLLGQFAFLLAIASFLFSLEYIEDLVVVFCVRGKT